MHASCRPTRPLGYSCTFSSSVDLANNPTFGQLGGGGGEGDGTAWWDLGQWSSQVNEINNNYNNNYNNNTYYNNSYGNNFESLAFEGVPQCLPYQTSQACKDLDWQHPDSDLALQQITTLIGSDADVSRWVSTHAPRPMIQGLPLMQLDLALSPVVDMPMQPWDLQYIHGSSPPMNQEQLVETPQLGQNACAFMSSLGWQTTGNPSMAHTLDIAWQRGTESSSSTSPTSSGVDQFICGYPNCKETRPSQKALKTHQKCHKKPYRCAEDGCQKHFCVPAHLERHQKTHRRRDSEEIKYCCPDCPKAYPRNMPRGEPAIGMPCWGDRCALRPARGFYPLPAL
ncbi:hypothetical protein QBC32DRAFT_372309 [Pseudoneurospora amorphoporcata]|uniref:C2H2-type domain-containing protein n=1 Tax=Pseudoneurospora amorphoporcata TaxID=241081 RepID=A0AAN6NQJ7_9PEZI|nr:hypothetical protein QBC32DRAFT_372309 [Pseudoneurospora amorphoporcata]